MFILDCLENIDAFPS